MTRNVLMGLALACVAGILPSVSYADHGDRDWGRREDHRWEEHRYDRDDHYDRDRDHDRGGFSVDIGSIPGGPAYDARPVQVWVPDVYQTVTQRVWVPDVTQTVVDHVYVPDHYEWRDVATGRHHDRIVRQQVLVPAQDEDQPRTVVVTPGHYEDRQTQQLVSAGHWETRYEPAPRPQFGFNLHLGR